jgi:hypothetical protein
LLFVCQLPVQLHHQEQLELAVLVLAVPEKVQPQAELVFAVFECLQPENFWD